MELWKVVFLAVIFTGLVIGWIFGPLLGLAVIVVALVLIEAFPFRKSRPKATKKKLRP